MAILKIEVSGKIKVLDALAAVDKEARFAQKTAVRAAGRRGRSVIAKTLAGKYSVPLKLFKKRARFFNARRQSKGDPVARASLWLGLRAPIRAGEHKSALTQLRTQHPQGFIPKLKSGHVGWFHRTQPSRPVGPGARDKPKLRGALPIKEFTLDISPGAAALITDTARRVMRTTYPETFKKDYLRRINKVKARRRR